MAVPVFAVTGSVFGTTFVTFPDDLLVTEQPAKIAPTDKTVTIETVFQK